MAPNNLQAAGDTAQANCANGEPEVVKLRRECEQLRQQLAAAEKERDDNLSSCYAYMRATVTDEEKADMERYCLDLMKNGGVSVRESLDELRQTYGSY